MFFLAALHRWLSRVSLLSCLLTFAKYLLNSSAFLLSQTISFLSWIRGCGLVFFIFPQDYQAIAIFCVPPYLGLTFYNYFSMLLVWQIRCLTLAGSLYSLLFLGLGSFSAVFLAFWRCFTASLISEVQKALNFLRLPCGTVFFAAAC